MSASDFVEKARRLLEELTGMIYKVERLEPESGRLRISPKALKEEESEQMEEGV